MKDGLDGQALERLAGSVEAAWPAFDAGGFLKKANSGLEKLELKDRVRHIIAVMDLFLPDDYPRALEIVVRAGEKFPAGRSDDSLAGFAAWPLIDWVPEYGLDHFDASLKALKKLTGLFSAEFAVRPFLIRDPERALRHLHTWVDDPDEHVRRLVSEGTRPRLPWGCRLPMFVEDPSPVIELLARLRDDPSEYVRRSVGNNLNDIAKDHPARVVKVCRAWKKGASGDRTRIIRRGLRTLVKQGDKGALKVLGYTTEPRVKASLDLSAGSLRIGGDLGIEVTLVSQARSTQKLVVDYVVHHVRANGKSTPKVFKLRTLDLAPGQTIHLKKKHSFAPRSVRRYYPGRHTVELLVGGQSLGRSSFTMTE
ncbi:MAG: DNA alkylation repair protein [Candidatus Krumholzibacteriota bacterium]